MQGQYVSAYTRFQCCLKIALVTLKFLPFMYRFLMSPQRMCTIKLIVTYPVKIVTMKTIYSNKKAALMVSSGSITKPFECPIPRCDDAIAIIDTGSQFIWIINLNTR